MVSRILIVLGAAAYLVYAILGSRDKWTLTVLTADRAVEMCIASFIVAMFRVRAILSRANAPNGTHTGHRFLPVFLLFRVINDSIYQAGSARRAVVEFSELRE